MHDVVVVGAGPAGSATAVHLARLGHSVLLLDRAHFPRAMANLGRRPTVFEKVLAINAGDRGLGCLRPRDVSALLFGV